jgi:general secretion pathway protein K
MERKSTAGQLPSAKGSQSQGFALLGVLWAGVVLGLLAGAVSDIAQGDVEQARSLREQAMAEAAAEGAARIGLHALLPGPGQDWDFAADGRILGWRLGDVEFRFRAEPEAWRLDLNAADETALADLFTFLGADPDRAGAIAAAVADFRDPDGDTRPNGAEAADYARAGFPLGPKNAPFEAVEELARVWGMDGDLFALALPYLTVHGSAGAVRRGGGFRPERIVAVVSGPAAFALPLEAAPQVLAPGDDTAGSPTLVRVRGEAATLGGARSAHVIVAQLGADGQVTLRSAMAAAPQLFP